MAQMVAPRHVENSTGKHFLSGGDEAQRQGHWTPPHTPRSARSCDNEDDHGHHHEKKSVMLKVKEKAKKWKQLLQKKKHGHEAHDAGSNGNATPSWGVTLDENVDKEKNPEYHGAPMYESEMAPDVYRDAESKDWSLRKEIADQHSDACKSIAVQNPMVVTAGAAEKHITEEKHRLANEGLPADNGSNKTLTETVSDMLAPVSDMLAPAYTMVSEATNMITSKIQAPMLSARDEAVAKQMWDKGVSVKEYLLQKLEPGEDERALSQVITEAISPRKKAMDDTVERVKEAVSSVFGVQMPNGSPIPVSTMPHSVSTIPHRSSVPENSAPPPAFTRLQQASMLSSKSLKYPVSRNMRPVLHHSKSQPVHRSNIANAAVYRSSHEGEIEETGGRTLQEYLN